MKSLAWKAIFILLLLLLFSINHPRGEGLCFPLCEFETILLALWKLSVQYGVPVVAVYFAYPVLSSRYFVHSCSTRTASLCLLIYPAIRTDRHWDFVSHQWLITKLQYFHANQLPPNSLYFIPVNFITIYWCSVPFLDLQSVAVESDVNMHIERHGHKCHHSADFIFKYIKNIKSELKFRWDP